MILLGLLLAGCPGGSEDTGTLPEIRGPDLAHTAPEVLSEGEDLHLEVEATDPDGVVETRAFFRAQGESVWEPLALERDGETWSGTISGTRIQRPALQYYFQARDGSELHTTSTLPEEGRQGPFQVPVVAVGQPLPWQEDFEEGASAISLFDLGWAWHAEAFEGNGWELTSARAHEGSYSVRHRRGAASAPAVDDWLVSPPVDLSGEEKVQVTWHETGDHVHLATHSLWISTGSPDPAEGDFQLVEDLPSPPGHAWGQTHAVDLSAWAGGEAPATLAWRYEGERADAWYLDDVEVRALAPDLHLVDWSFTPVEPGGQTTVTLALENRTTEPAPDLVLTPSVDPALGAFAGPVSAGDLEGEGARSVDLVLDVDAAHPDNAYLPFSVTAASGEETRTWDLQLVVGEHTLAGVTVAPEEPGLVQAWIGVGDPAAPLHEQIAFSEVLEAGSTALEVDLTGLDLGLPPAPGPDRWYLRVVAGVPGAVTAFSIGHDGAVHDSDDLGPWEADLDSLFFLPRPPAPAVTDQVTDPAQVEPGDTVTWTLTLANQGTATTGETTVAVTSEHPEVGVLTPDPVPLGEGGWEADAEGTLEVEVEVLPTQIDSRPVPFLLTFTDEVESFEVTAFLEVPWPVLHVTGLRVDDSDGGDGDGLPEAGETVDLQVDLTNIGGRGTFGALACTLSAPEGAPVDLVEATDALPPASLGQTRTADFTVALTGGAEGEDLGLWVTCTDEETHYEAEVGLVVGERPWLRLAPFDDPEGDAVGGYPFDLRNGRYRFDGTWLHLELTSWTPYDPSTLFLEAWGESPGAPFTYYQVVAQSGVGTLRGYQFGFTRLDDPVVTDIDETTVRISLPVASMGLAVDRLRLGFAAGFCGGAVYYCDHFPDGWGNPYGSGLVLSRWLTLEW